MTKKEARGTKRTCQNSDCGSRFYDLGRNPIVCPICQSQYVIASAALTGTPVEDLKPKKQPEFADAEAAPDAAESEDAVALADIEVAEEPVAAEEDETFLEEEEEDGGDVSGIIGGNVDDQEEEP